MQHSDTASQNVNIGAESEGIQSSEALQDRADQQKLAMGLVLDCARIVVRLLVQAMVEPSILYLLYHANMQRCMWQLMLSDTDSLRQMAITIMHLTLSIGKTHKDYLIKYAATLSAATQQQGSIDHACN